MPFSNRQLEGFENKIATVMAKAFDASPELRLVGAAPGFHQKHHERDAEGGALQHHDRRAARATIWCAPRSRTTDRPMCSSIAKDKGLQIKSLDDPMLKKLRIGVHLLGDDYSNPPPVHALSKRGIVGNVVGFETFYSAQNPPSRIIDAVAERQDRRRHRLGSRRRLLRQASAGAAGDGAGPVRQGRICPSPSTSRWASSQGTTHCGPSWRRCW